MSCAAPFVIAPSDWRLRKMLEPSSYHRLWYSSLATRSPNPSSKASGSTSGAARLPAAAYVVQDPVDELVRRHGRQLLAGPQTHAHHAGFLVAVAGDDHVRHLVRLG